MKHLLASASLAVVALVAPLSPADRLPIGASIARAQQAVVLENLSYSWDKASVRIPRVTVEGTTSSKADIEAVFGAKTFAALGEAIKKVSARSISIPTIELTQDMPDGKAVTTYRDTVLRDIRNGAIGEWVTPVTTSRGSVKTGVGQASEFTMDMANMVLKGVDAPLMFRFIYDKAAPDEKLANMAAEQTIGRLAYKIGDQMSFSVNSAVLRDFKAKPLSTPFMETMTNAQPRAGARSREAERSSLIAMVEMMTSMSIGHMEMSGMVGEAKSPTQKQPVKFSIDKVSGAGGGDINGRFSLQGLKVEADGGVVNFGEFTVDGVDLSSMWTAVRNAAQKPDFDPSDLNAGDLIPRISLVRFGGIDINVPDPKAAGQMIKARLGLLETKMSNHVGPIPADIAVNLDKLQMDIPQNTSDSGLKQILDLGYRALDISARYDQAWSEAARTLTLRDFRVASTGMFAAQAKAEISGATRELFNTDRAIAAVAALGLSARNLDFALTNSGLFQKLIEKQAKDTRRKVEDVRAEFAAGATLMVPMFMGDHPAARVIGQALGKFVADPKNIRLVATAQGGGIGAADFMAAPNPMDVLKKVDIKATANE